MYDIFHRYKKRMMFANFIRCQNICLTYLPSSAFRIKFPKSLRLDVTLSTKCSLYMLPHLRTVFKRACLNGLISTCKKIQHHLPDKLKTEKTNPLLLYYLKPGIKYFIRIHVFYIHKEIFIVIYLLSKRLHFRRARSWLLHFLILGPNEVNFFW